MSVDPTRRHRGGDDAGFTLVEVLVAVAIIAVVMLGVGAVFVATASGTDAQGLHQTAVRVATDGLDRVRALGAGVAGGRTAAAVGTGWPAAVSGRLAGLPVATDPRLPAGATGTPVLPLQVPQTVDGLVYTQSFYVAGCQLTTAGRCQAAATADTVPMYDVVVAVGWRHTSCPAGACTYQLSTLVAATTSDPLFNSTVKAAAPAVTTAAAQVVDVGESVTGPKVTVTGGNGAVTLTAVGLPPGISLDPTTNAFTGVARTVTAASTVTVTATDRFGLFSSAQLVWTVNPLPTLAAATAPVVTGVASSIGLASALKLVGGTAPFTWSCGTLPPGLTLDPTAGTLAALLPGVATVAPSCTVTDARGRKATATLTLSVLAPLLVTAPTNGTTVAVRRATALTVPLTATGCAVACTWSADRLPAGVTVSAAGALAGAPTTAGTTVTVFTATDAAGRTATAQVTWTVT